MAKCHVIVGMASENHAVEKYQVVCWLIVETHYSIQFSRQLSVWWFKLSSLSPALHSPFPSITTSACFARILNGAFSRGKTLAWARGGRGRGFGRVSSFGWKAAWARTTHAVNTTMVFMRAAVNSNWHRLNTHPPGGWSCRRLDSERVSSPLL